MYMYVQVPVGYAMYMHVLNGMTVWWALYELLQDGALRQLRQIKYMYIHVPDMYEFMYSSI